MNGDGSSRIQITKVEGGYPRYVSGDGKWIYFESGLHQTLWRASAEGGDETQVSERTVYSPAFSRDGDFVAYFLPAKGVENRFQVAVMSLEDRKVLSTFSLVDEKSVPVKIAWASDDKSLTYITETGSKSLLWRQYLDHAGAQLVADLGDEEIEDCALSPDGKDFGFISGKWIHDAVLIEGLK